MAASTRIVAVPVDWFGMRRTWLVSMPKLSKFLSALSPRPSSPRLVTITTSAPSLAAATA